MNIMNNLINEKYILDTNKRLLILGCEGHSKVVTDIDILLDLMILSMRIQIVFQIFFLGVKFLNL